jgi:hypothetical protein
MDGEAVTEEALQVLTRMFKDQLSAEAVPALRVLFKLDRPEDLAVEEAMVNRGGAAELEQFAIEKATPMDNV